MKTRDVFDKQGWHLLAVLVLLAGVRLGMGLDGMLAGEFIGLDTLTWLWLAVLIPVVHQVYVMLVWRTELMNHWLSRRFGDRGFYAYGVFFMLLLFGRPLSILALSIANQETLALDWGWRTVLVAALGLPFLYLAYSVKKYFGVKRALGADHFDPAYRSMPFEKRGIHKYTENGMYIYGFFLLWMIPVFLASKAGLLAAAFNHLYIWAHYFTTEKPDMLRIYGDQD